MLYNDYDGFCLIYFLPDIIIFYWKTELNIKMQLLHHLLAKKTINITDFTYAGKEPQHKG